MPVEPLGQRRDRRATTGPSALIATVPTPTTATASQTSVTSPDPEEAGGARCDDRDARPARTGTSTSAIAAPRSAAASVRRSRICGTSKREEQCREGRVEPELLGVGERVTEERADRRPTDPRRVQREAGADQHPWVVPAVTLGGDRPRLVDDELGVEEPRPRATRRGTARPRRRSGPYRAFSRSAAATAAATVPPAPSTETAANCAEPANVVADITIGAAQPQPAARASRPKDTPNATTATASGAAARAPSRCPALRRRSRSIALGR